MTDVGRQLGRYRIVSALGSGGMGDVYRAHDARLARDVAIKFVKPAAGGAEQTAAQTAALMSEARAASGLSHANVCQLHEVDTADGRTFLVMELVEGETLSAAITRGRLSADRVARYGAQMAGALAHAHDRGIIHRDLKSANVMVTPSGGVKVLDFGIARRELPSQIEETTKSVVPFERADAIAGTLPYMAPETVQSGRTDTRSDIWSLGVVLFELLSGRRPFTGASPFELSSAIVNAPTPQLPADVPQGLRLIVDRCLRKVPGERYQRAAEAAAALEAASTDPSAAQVAPRRRTRSRLIAAAAAIALLAAAVFGWFAWNVDRSAPGVGSLAVLPFADLSPGGPSEYLAEGVTDAIITELGQLGALRVISRTSSMRFRDSTKSIPEIARELDVDAVLEGSLVRDADRVRVTARLIRAATETSLWTGSYEQELRDILALQRDFARTLAHELRVTVTPDQETQLARRQRINPAAVEAYLRGRSQWFRRTPESMRLSIKLFEEAIAADSQYAAPYAGLANTYVLMSLSEVALATPSESIPAAKAAAARALELDPATADAHTALAYAELWSWNLEASERAFQRAIALNPNDANARGWHAVRLAAGGEFEAALAEAKVAQQLDPVSPIFPSLLSWVCHLAGRHDDAANYARHVLITDPDFAMAYRRLGVAYKHLRDYERAAEALQRAVSLSGRHADTLAHLGQVRALQGRTAEATELLAELNRPVTAGYMPAFNRALVYTGLGNRDAAFRSLEQAYNERYGPLALIRVEPDFASLRDDPRFEVLVRKIFP